MVEQAQKACAQPVWIITFKIEIKLIANDNTYKCVIVQNTSACLHASKWSFGYNNRTLLSYFHSSAIPPRGPLNIERKDRTEACGSGLPSERAGKHRAGLALSWELIESIMSPEPETELGSRQLL